MHSLSMPEMPKVKVIKVHPTRRQCMSCPNHRLERGFLHWRVSCSLPHRRVEYTASGKEKLLACPLVDPMSRELDKFYEEYNRTRYSIKNSMPHRAPILPANSTVPPMSSESSGAERRAARPVERKSETATASYSEMVATAATIMDLTEWKDALDNNMLASVFDCVCVYGFAITAGVLSALLGLFLPIPAIILSYIKFISVAVQLVAVYAGGSKLLRARRQVTKLEAERDRLEIELQIALTKSKYKRAQIDKAATKKRTSA